MMRPRLVRAWLGLALLSLLVAVPASADPSSDLFALFFQTSGVAAANGLNMGERNSLVTKIIGAISSLERGHEKTAANNLGAFINEVNALEQSGRLGAADAHALSNAAT